MRKNEKNYRIKNLLSNQKGMALLTTLIFVFVLVTFSVALLTMTSNDTKLSTLQKESTRAFYLAETGIDRALWYLNTPLEYGGKDKFTFRPEVPYPADTGSNTEYYQFTIENIGTDDPTATPPTYKTDIIEITSVGTVKEGKYSSGKRTVVVTAKIGISQFSSSSYDYAIFADLLITINGNITINGDIHANESIGGSNNSPTISGKQTIGGDLDYPTIDFEGYRTKILLGELDGKYYGDNNSKIFNTDEPITGIHFIDGDVDIHANINIHNGAILATGNIKTYGNSVINHTRDEEYKNPLALAAEGNITILGTVITEGVIQSKKDIEVKGTVDINRGALFANNVTVDGNVIVNYDPELLGKPVDYTGLEVYIKTSWREAY